MLNPQTSLILTCKTRCINSARFVWSHRTKTLGALGMAAGGVEKFIAQHPDFHLPARGTLLIIFGGLVAIVGLINELEAFFST